MVARSAVEGAPSEGKLSGRAHKVVREMHGRVLWGTEQVLGDQPASGQKFTERKEQPQKKKTKKKTGWIISNLYLYAYGLVGLFLKRAYIVSILNSKCVGGSLLHQKMLTGDLLERMFRPGC